MSADQSARIAFLAEIALWVPSERPAGGFPRSASTKARSIARSLGTGAEPSEDDTPCSGVTAADVEPLLNGYFYFDTPEIKDVYERGILNNALTAVIAGEATAAEALDAAQAEAEALLAPFE